MKGIIWIGTTQEKGSVIEYYLDSKTGKSYEFRKRNDVGKGRAISVALIGGPLVAISQWLYGDVTISGREYHYLNFIIIFILCGLIFYQSKKSIMKRKIMVDKSEEGNEAILEIECIFMRVKRTWITGIILDIVIWCFVFFFYHFYQTDFLMLDLLCMDMSILLAWLILVHLHIEELLRFFNWLRIHKKRK